MDTRNHAADVMDRRAGQTDKRADLGFEYLKRAKKSAPFQVFDKLRLQVTLSVSMSIVCPSYMMLLSVLPHSAPKEAAAVLKEAVRGAERGSISNLLLFTLPPNASFGAS